MEKALLIGIITQEQPEEVATESINELEFLTLTAGAKTKKKFYKSLLSKTVKHLLERVKYMKQKK